MATYAHTLLVERWRTAPQLEQSTRPHAFRLLYKCYAERAKRKRFSFMKIRRELPRTMSTIDFFRTTTVLADGKTLCLAPAPKGTKVKLDQGRLRENRKELELTFDRVLGERAEQKEVYDQVKACVRLPFSGENLLGFRCG